MYFFTTRQVFSLIPEDHISNLAVDTVRRLLKPLSEKYAINYFNLTVSYPNHTGFTLHTHPDFYQSWFANEFPMCQFNNANGWYFWERCSAPGMMQIANEMNLGKGILHIEQSPQFSVTSAFAMQNDPLDAETFFLNNLDLLKSFSQYFIREASNYICKAKSELITYPFKMIDPTLMPNLKFNKDTTSHFSNHEFGPFSLLSPRELQCYELLLAGFSMIDISEKLTLSPSSVNMYLRRVKEKLKCRNKSGLFEVGKQFGYNKSPQDYTQYFALEAL